MYMYVCTLYVHVHVSTEMFNLFYTENDVTCEVANEMLSQLQQHEHRFAVVQCTCTWNTYRTYMYMYM